MALAKDREVARDGEDAVAADDPTEREVLLVLRLASHHAAPDLRVPRSGGLREERASGSIGGVGHAERAPDAGLRERASIAQRVAAPRAAAGRAARGDRPLAERFLDGSR